MAGGRDGGAGAASGPARPVTVAASGPWFWVTGPYSTPLVSSPNRLDFSDPGPSPLCNLPATASSSAPRPPVLCPRMLGSCSAVAPCTGVARSGLAGPRQLGCTGAGRGASLGFTLLQLPAVFFSHLLQGTLNRPPLSGPAFRLGPAPLLGCVPMGVLGCWAHSEVTLVAARDGSAGRHAGM